MYLPYKTFPDLHSITNNKYKNRLLKKKKNNCSCFTKDHSVFFIKGRTLKKTSFVSFILVCYDKVTNDPYESMTDSQLCRKSALVYRERRGTQ